MIHSILLSAVPVLTFVFNLEDDIGVSNDGVMKKSPGEGVCLFTKGWVDCSQIAQQLLDNGYHITRAYRRDAQRDNSNKNGPADKNGKQPIGKKVFPVSITFEKDGDGIPASRAGAANLILDVMRNRFSCYATCFYNEGEGRLRFLLEKLDSRMAGDEGTSVQVFAVDGEGKEIEPCVCIEDGLKENGDRKDNIVKKLPPIETPAVENK